jgi:hypothetical protein
VNGWLSLGGRAASSPKAPPPRPFKLKTEEPRGHACGHRLVKKTRARAPQESAQLLLAAT